MDQPVTAPIDAGLHAPALLELDLTDFGVTEERDTQLRALLLRHAAAGGLTGFSLHAGNPVTGGGVDDRNDVDLPVHRRSSPPAHLPHTQAGANREAGLGYRMIT